MATILYEAKFDSSGAVTEMRRFDGQVEGLEKSGTKASRGLAAIKSAASAVAVSLGAIQIGRFTADAVNMAGEQEKAYTRLATNLANVGVSYNDVSGDLQSMFGHLQRVTEYGDTDTADALQSLVGVTGNYQAALKVLEPTMDLAAARGIELGTASELVGRAVAGNFAALSRYGIVLDDSTLKQLKQADAMERAEIMAGELSKRFGGSAENMLNNYANKVSQLNNYWGDFKEALGDTVIALTTSEGSFNGARSAIEWMTEAVKNAGEAVIFLFNFNPLPLLESMLASTADAFASWAEDLVKIAAELPFGDTLTAGLLDNIAEIRKGIGDWSDDLEMDMSIAFDVANEAATDFRAKVDGLTASVGGPSGATPAFEAHAEAVGKAEQAYRDANSEAGNLIQSTAAYIDFIEAMGDFGEQLGDFRSRDIQLESGTWWYDEAATQSALDSMTADIVREHGEAAAAARAKWEAEFGELGVAISDVIVGSIMTAVTDGFNGEDFIASLADGFEGLSNQFGNQLSDTLYNSLASKDWAAFSMTDGNGNFQLGQGWREAGMAFGMGMLSSGVQTGNRRQAILGGALTGAMIGTQIAPGWGTLIGAGAGALAGWGMSDPGGMPTWMDPLGLFDNDQDPIRTRLFLAGRGGATYSPLGWQGTRMFGSGNPLGEGNDTPPQGEEIAGWLYTEGQNLTDEQEQVFLQEIQSLTRRVGSAFRKTLQAFGDATLFDLAEAWEGIPAADFDASIQEVMALLAQVTLPDAFGEDFFVAFSTGLDRLGLTAETIDQLSLELSSLPLDERLNALAGFVEIVRRTRALLEIDPLELSRQTPEDAFSDFMTSALGDIEVLSAGWEDLSLVDRANELSLIGDVWASALDQTLAMLQAIDSAERATQDNIARAQETYNLRGMTDSEQRRYFEEQIGTYMGLLSGASTLEETQTYSAEVLRYIQALSQFNDPNDPIGLHGGTWGEYINSLYDELSSVSADQYQELRDTTQEQFDQLTEALAAATDALTDLNDTMNDGGGATVDPLDDGAMLTGGEDIVFQDSSNLAKIADQGAETNDLLREIAAAVADQSGLHQLAAAISNLRVNLVRPASTTTTAAPASSAIW